MTLGHETRWAYSTTLPSPHGARKTEVTVSRLKTLELELWLWERVVETVRVRCDHCQRQTAREELAC